LDGKAAAPIMSDVFLSYAREDRRLAERLVSQLEREGLTVWWDRAIPVGRDFDRAIGEELDAASCVVVIWSQWSVQSEYVRDEAQVALDSQRLVPIAVGSAKPPLGFRRRQTLSLSEAEDELEPIVTAVGEAVARPTTAGSPRRVAVGRRRIDLLKIAGGAALAVPALLIGVAAGADLSAEVSTLPSWIWAPLAALPLLAVFGGQLWPRVLSRLRARRLAAVASSSVLRASYFRVTPYSSSDGDQQRFNRFDGVHHEILAWLRSADRGIHYLTGSSGSGKTSLLSAYVLPQLSGDGAWRIMTIRGFRNPLGELLRQLGPAEEAPEGISPAAAVLAAIDAWREERPEQKLLVVFDQFEEFLILHQRDPERLQALEELLLRLEESELQGVVLLLVLRSDYIGLLHELEQRGVLAPMDHGANWREVPPFKERDAWRFLSGSGLQLGPRVRERLFRQIADIEEARGLVRPITLNMVGLVIDRGGSTKIRSARGRSGSGLLTEYLESCLRSGDVRDHAPAILAPMLTSAGTKHPRSLAEVSRQSGFPKSVVAGCLAHLGRAGLVRRLDVEQGIWEVSHDFVARLLAIVLGQRRRSVWRIVAAWSFPASLAVWILAFLLLPSLLRERVAPDRITARVLYSGRHDGMGVPEFDTGATLRLALRRRAETPTRPPGRWMAGLNNAEALLMQAPDAQLEAQRVSSTEEAEGTPNVPVVVRVTTFGQTAGRLGPFAWRQQWADAELEAAVVSEPPYELLETLRDPERYDFLVDLQDSWEVTEFEEFYSLPAGYLREHGPFIGNEDLGDILQPLELRASLVLMIGGEEVATGTGIPAFLTEVREDWSRTLFVVRFTNLTPLTGTSEGRE
jgi:hypothetical protein